MGIALSWSAGYEGVGPGDREGVGGRKSVWDDPTHVSMSGSVCIHSNLEAGGPKGLRMKTGSGKDSPSIFHMPKRKAAR